jgi:GAF domain-containing protein
MRRVGRNASGGVQVTSGEGLIETMSEAIDPVGLMQRVADQTVELIPGADGVMIGLADRQGVSFVWGAGVNASHVGTRVNLDSSLSGLAIRRGELLWCHDTEIDPRVDKEVCRRNSVGSAVCIPLTRERESLGVLAIIGSRAHAFTEDDVASLVHVADSVVVAICLTRELSRVNRSLLDLSHS